MTTFLTTNGTRAQGSIEQLAAMCKADGHTFEVRPSRRGNFKVIRINSKTVARAFDTEIEAIAFELDRACPAPSSEDIDEA